jgi:hypothetical protein
MKYSKTSSGPYLGLGRQKPNLSRETIPANLAKSLFLREQCPQETEGGFVAGTSERSGSFQEDCCPQQMHRQGQKEAGERSTPVCQLRGRTTFELSFS